ncbi:MAG: alanine--tRNA ligase, partial [Candidatus Margulisiibacteriota bacterium]
ADSNFETDLFQPLIKKILELSRVKDNQLSTRIVADHLRAMTYLIADGAYPGNEKRGYVVRRIIRRSVVHGRKLGIEGSFLFKLVPTVIEMGQHNYPELKKNKDLIIDLIKLEEESFEARLEDGMKLIMAVMEKNKAAKVIPGEEAFKLHDTFGFPIDITREIAAEAGFKVDQKAFEAAMEKQREMARGSGRAQKEKRLEALKLAQEKYKPTHFVGYEKVECETKVVGLLPDENGIILEKTPFYPEGGGQTADTGILHIQGKELIVQDVFGSIGGVIVHAVDSIEEIKPGEKAKATINVSRRHATQNHHTATHLLHAALRKSLGESVKQSGSFVGPDRLRFDYSYPSALNSSQILEIEKFVNQRIKDKIKLDISQKSYEEAVKAGAMALFGEKYGDRVRVVQVPGTSTELCAGCHVSNTADITFFKILKDEALQSGVRRIEAVAGQPAKVAVMFRAKAMRDSIMEQITRHKKLQREMSGLGGEIMLEPAIFQVDIDEINRIAQAIDEVDPDKVKKFSDHLQGRIEWLEGRNHKLEAEIDKLRTQEVAKMGDDLASEAKEIAGKKVIVKEVSKIPIEHLRVIADKVKDKLGSCVIILASAFEDKVVFLVTVSDDLAQGGVNAGHIMQAMAEATGGKGGGRPNKAEGGGKDPSKIKDALEKALQILSK